MQHADTLIAELEVSLPERPSSQRFTILRKLTDLFLAEADAYSDECTQLFDELMTRLIEQIERQALIELSNRLAPVKRALPTTIGQLSRHDDIDIAEPVLAQSGALTERDLVEIAKAKSQGHLRAIAGRARLGEPVTEILVDRGDAQVAAKVAGNPGARFSRWTLDKVVARAEKDESIALAVANRIDLPPDLLDQLVRRATTAVQQRLFANSRSETRQKISQVLAIVSDRVARSTAPSSRRSLIEKRLPHNCEPASCIARTAGTPRASSMRWRRWQNCRRERWQNWWRRSPTKPWSHWAKPAELAGPI